MRVGIILEVRNTPEKETATHSNILAWRMLRTEEPGGLRSMWSQQSRTRLKRLAGVAACNTPWASQVALLVKNLPAKAANIREVGLISVRKIPWRSK